MKINYERFTVTLVQTTDGFSTQRYFYKATYVVRPDLVGIGQSREDAATDLLRRLFS